MKSKLLPLSLFTIILGVTSIILATGLSNGPGQQSDEGQSAFTTQAEYFTKIRANQVTHKIDPADAVRAMETANSMALKSGASLNLNWESMGPDNAPGVVRAMLFDNQAASNQSLILAGVTGGIWRTENLGATWTKLNQAGQNLKVSCMIQDPEGNIYAGTGDGFCTNDVQYTQNNIYYSGIVGTGIYKSTDSDNFELLPETAPQITEQNDTVDFAYIYDLAYDVANTRLYSATNTGLFYSDDKGTTWSKVTKYESDSITYGVTLHLDSTIYCDSWTVEGDELIIEGQSEVMIDTLLFETVEESRINNELEFGIVECSAVEVGTSGVVMATFNNKVYVSDGGADPVFTNVSSNPSNMDFFSRDIKYYTTNLAVIDTNDQVYNRGQLVFNDTTNYDNVEEENSPLSLATQGRTQIAIAPTDDNVYYAVCSDALGYMENMYLSTDRGRNWEIIFPGGSTSSLLPFEGSSCFNMALTVFPNNPYKVLLGGDDLWLGEQLTDGDFFDWGAGPISTSLAPPSFPSYLPNSHHGYVFFPGSNSKFAISTSKGISFGTFQSGSVSYQQIIRGLSTSQVYTLGISGLRNWFLAGVQSNGVQFVSGLGNTPQTGENVYGFTGGSCQTSVINPSAFMLSDADGNMNRTNDFGLSFSLNFTPPTTNLVITPFAKWESFNDYKSKTTVKFIADRTYTQGEELLCHSANKGVDGGKGYPFYHVLEQETLEEGDSIYVQDIVQSKFFIATHNAVYMTRDILKFDSIVTYNPGISNRRNMWKVLQTVGNFSKCSALGVSGCGNYLFVGTENGRIYRIANIQDAFDKNSGDIDSPFCVLASAEIIPEAMTDRYVTSISVDPQDPNHILVTLGNYGNESYVYQSTNALDAVDAVAFNDITGGLPKAPAYSSIIEMNNSEIGVIGTELGIFSTQNLLSGDPEWTIDANGVGKAMVVRMEQQKVYKAGFILENPDPTAEPIIYPAVNNYGDIYCATFGRGVFRDGSFYQPVGVPEIHSPSGTISEIEVDIYPNPVSDQANVTFNLLHGEQVTLRVLDVTGKVVKHFQITSPSEGKNDFSFDCSDLNNGVYILNLRAGNSVQNTKFIVK
jgi:hypothetical protein